VEAEQTKGQAVTKEQEQGDAEDNAHDRYIAMVLIYEVPPRITTTTFYAF
jgi:hypothetical protein